MMNKQTKIFIHASQDKKNKIKINTVYGGIFYYGGGLNKYGYSPRHEYIGPNTTMGNVPSREEGCVACMDR